MSSPSLQKLSKVLALADSEHEGEALAAVRVARTLLRKKGMDFSDVLSDADPRKKGFGSPSPLEALYLRRQLQERTRQVIELQKELDTARAAFAYSEKERTRWEKLAKDTMDKLWKIARDVGEDKL